MSPLGFSLPVFHGFNFTGGMKLSPEFVALTLSLILYTAAFIAEIVRAGIAGVPKGQGEAAAALGLNAAQTRKFVVVPEALRLIVPPLTSQYLNLFKNSSLAVFIGYPDLVQVFAGTVLNQTGAAVPVITVTMAVYLFVSLIGSLAMNLFNRRIAGAAALTQAFVRAAPAPQLPPPMRAGGRIATLSRNLLGSPKSLALTLGALVLAVWAVPDLLRYFLFGAVWHGDAATCRATDGACWPFIAEKLPYFVYGSYPLDQRWRVNLVFAIGALLDRVAADARARQRGGSVCGSPFSSILSSPSCCFTAGRRSACHMSQAISGAGCSSP